MRTEITLARPFTGLPDVPRASSDDQLLEIWLHGRSLHTQRREIPVRRFVAEEDRRQRLSSPNLISRATSCPQFDFFVLLAQPTVIASKPRAPAPPNVLRQATWVLRKQTGGKCV
jgi:hypothetical protein